MGQSINLATSGTQCIGAWLAKPAGACAGGIVVVQEVFGVNAHIRAVVEQFAQHGYSAIAPAFFDHVESGVELDYDRSGINKGRALASQIGMDRAVEDVASAAQSIASAGKIGVVGYCWGGTVAFVAGLRLGLPAISYYGSRNVKFLHEPVASPLMFHFGERDKSIPAAAIDRHRQVLPDAEIFTYPAGHGFNCDLRDGHDAASAALAQQRTLEFFDRYLRS